jgi:biofilm PGA synthesis N-glycosyltransferase PgaC
VSAVDSQAEHSVPARPTRAVPPVRMVDGRVPYVLITPARNEAQHIGRLLDCMVVQTHPPLCWVIVSDASTDGTDDIVEAYRRRVPWIRLLRMPERRERSFAAKVECFNAALDIVRGLEFEVIGSLDADISFAADYFEYLLSRFCANPELGVAGTPFVEDGRQYDYRFTSLEHVSGACQLFRRDCFDAIGGYVPITGGGIDWTAVTTARMRGWQTRTFTERTCRHHRTIGTGATGRVRAIFRQGQKDFRLGGHPVWQLFRAAYQMTRPPYLVGGVLLLAGYVRDFARGAERHARPELVAFHRAEQIARLRRMLTKFTPRLGGGAARG